MRRARRWSIALGIIALLGAGAYLFLARSGAAPAPTSRSPAGGRAPAVSVMAMAAQTADMAVYLSGLGSVTPLNTVTVRTRVDGELTKVLFREGQIVRAGDLLAEIDPRPFQVQLTQVEGQLARDEALLRNARVDLERYKTLVAQDSIPTQQLDTQVELVRQYEGVVKTDQGQIDNVKLRLVYCRITAPLNGRLGLRLVDPGNIVHASDQNGLVVITQLQPIAVVFTIPEDSLPPVLKKLNAGVELPVDAWDRDQRQRLASGSLLTVDNQIDPTTGTVRLKAIFPNADGRLFPSQFVNAHLRLDVKRGATVVPTAAIQQSAQGTIVYVVKPDRTATVRVVKVGVTEGDNASIESGVAPAELVVVDGADRLREGSLVALQPGPGAPAPRRGS